MAKHLIVCGHGAGDPGAGGNGINERDWTRNSLKPLMEKWARLLKSNTIEFYPVAQNMFMDTQKGWGAYAVKADSVTEIHLDSASSTATGGHAIIHTSLSPDQYDLAIAQVINKYVGWWGSVRGTQGINKRNNLLNCNVFVTRSGISYRLIELGFISNPTDVAKLQNNIDAVAKELVEAITGEKLAGSPAEPAPTPTPQPPKPTPGGFTVEPWNRRQSVDVPVLNVRAAQTAESGIVGTLTQGQTFNATRICRNGQNVNGYTTWFEVNGRGWVSGAYVTEIAGESAPAPAPTGGTYTFRNTTNVRDRPSLSGTVVAQYQPGQSVVYDQTVQADGYTWMGYIGGSGKRRWVAKTN